MKKICLIPDMDGYYKISTKAEVWSCRVSGNKEGKKGEWKRIKGSIHPNGYRMTDLYKNGKKKTYFLHKLVLITFRGPRPFGKQARHYPDNDKLNCNLSNLHWSTPKVNMKDKIKDKTDSKGIKNGMAKLNERSVLKIRKEYASGHFTMRELADLYFMSVYAIYAVIRKKNWSHV